MSQSRNLYGQENRRPFAPKRFRSAFRTYGYRDERQSPLRKQVAGASPGNERGLMCQRGQQRPRHRYHRPRLKKVLQEVALNRFMTS